MQTNQGWIPAKPASAGSKWPKGLPSLSKQDQGPCLPTTNLQSIGVLRARFPTWVSYTLRRMLVSFQAGVFTWVSSLIWRWGSLTKAPLSQSELQGGLQQFIHWEKQRNYPQSSYGFLLADYHFPSQSEAWPKYDHFLSSRAISGPPEDIYQHAIFNIPLLLTIPDNLHILN